MRRLHLPIVANGVAVTIPRLELTQAVQNAALSVPLVAGRPTVARVQVVSASAASNLSVTLAATRSGRALSGSPLRKSGVTAATRATPGSAQVSFLLPASWLSGGVSLTVSVHRSDGGAPLAQRLQTVTFNAVAALRLTVVPIRYEHRPTGQVYAPPTQLKFPAAVQAMFPVPRLDIQMRTPVTFRGDLTADDGAADRFEWERLFDQIATLKEADGAPPSTVYLGIIPSSALAEHRFYLAGLGGGQRVAVALDEQLVVPHELGHTLGRAHSPCGGAGGVDPLYPHVNGTIGAYGYNTTTGAFYDPVQTTDLMSYCEEWVSDYTYAGMLTNQAALVADAPALTAQEAAAAQAGGGSLLVRAHLPAGSAATGSRTVVEILPTYHLAVPPAAPVPGGDYAVALLAADGRELAVWPVALLEAAEYDVHIRSLRARLPLPDEPVAAVEIRERGVPVASRPLQSAVETMDVAGAHPAPGAAVEGDALVVQNPAQQPMLVRMISPSGATTLALDLVEAEARFPLAELPGGAHTVELVSADARALHPLNTATAPAGAPDSGALPLVLPDRPPVLTLAPVSGPAGRSIVLPAVVWDPEGAPLSTVQWRVDGAPAGEGPLLHLEVGDRPMRIEAQVSDAAGQTAHGSLLVTPVTDEPAP
jgi:hypothetical protein